MKLDPVVKRETGFIAVSTLICTLLLQLVFVVLRRWNSAVALGGAVGWILTVGNFFFMSRDVQRAVEETAGDPDNHRAEMRMKLSYTRRMLVMLAVIAASLLLDQIHWIPVIAAVLYPRLVITVRQVWERFVLKKNTDPAPASLPVQEEEETEEEDGFERMVGHFARRIRTDYSSAAPAEKQPESGGQKNENENKEG